MLVLLHVAIAIISVIYSSFLYFSPSKSKLRLTYVLVALTVLSGTVLIFAYPAHMVKSCVVGCLYIGGMVSVITLVRKKLAKIEAE